jgi:hypothetical protein
MTILGGMACFWGPSDIGRETLVRAAATIIDRFCCGTELLATRPAEPGFGRGGLPFPFVLPCLKARLAAVAAGWRLMQQKAGENAPGDGSAEGGVEHYPVVAVLKPGWKLEGTTKSTLNGMFYVRRNTRPPRKTVSFISLGSC